MKKRQKLLTDEQWKLIEPLLPTSHSEGALSEGGHQRRIEPVWMASCGFRKRASRGDFYPTSFFPSTSSLIEFPFRITPSLLDPSETFRAE
jgi:hypothetical protein